VKFAGGAHGVLADHSVGNEENFRGLQFALEIAELGHQLVVDVQATGRVHDDHVARGKLRFAYRAADNFERLVRASTGPSGHADRFRDLRELLARSGTIDVGRHDNRPVAMTGEPLRKLAGRGGLAGALQAHHHPDRRRARGEERLGVLAEEGEQFVADDFDDLLVRRKLQKDFGAQRLLADVDEELIGDRDVDVAIEQRFANLLECLIEVLLGQLALAAKILENALKFFCEIVEHGELHDCNRSSAAAKIPGTSWFQREPEDTMRRALSAMLLCLAIAVAMARPQSNSEPLFKNLGPLHHPIATTSPDAQRYFDQGLSLVYAFNHEEGIRSFERAAELDPKAAMPWWGEALALGPNYNMDVDAQRELQAYNAIQKALALSASGPEEERDFIMALARRYTNAPNPDLKKLAEDYASAMSDLYKKHPDDPDAGTLYAESLMDLNPWKLWTPDGRPGEHTEEIVRVLEEVLRRDPNHIGANHFYIHAVEASPHPEWALPSAKRLETLAPAAGHLVHMPAHIYERTGDYAASAHSNEAAVAADESFLAQTHTQSSMYGTMYYSHNLHFLTFACMMEGRMAEAEASAKKLANNVMPAEEEMPMVEAFEVVPTYVLLRFGRWQEILALPDPHARMPLTEVIWHFARGVADARTDHVEDARTERAAMEKLRKDVAEGPAWGMSYNDGSAIFDLAETSLDARIAAAGGDSDAAIAAWRKVVALEDAFSYDEPPGWYYPARESLGAALLAGGRGAEAEKVFRDDLQQNPRNPRSLYGLWNALEAEKRDGDAAWAHAQFDEAWTNSDVSLDLSDF